MRVWFDPAWELVMRVFCLHPATLAATCMLVLGGCGGVGFEHPLSDAETTAVDEQLIGFWEPVASSVGEADPEPGDLWPRIAVGKAADSATAMEAVALEVEDGVVTVKRLELLATRIGAHRYLSLRDPQETDKRWMVVRYDVTDDDLLRAQVLDAEVFAQAVDAGELKGEVRSPERGFEVPSLTVAIAASTDEVRTWLAAHADGCVEEKGLSLRRLVKKEWGGSADAVEPDEPPPPVPPVDPPDEPSDEPSAPDDS